VNRRGLLGVVSAGFALTVLRPALSGSRPMTVIYDERYADARAFAAYFRAHGAAPLPTRGDATALWYGALRQEGGAVAGLTAYPDLIIARSCGRELGLRLVFERPYQDRLADPPALLAAALSRPSPAAPSGRDASSDHLVAWLLMPRTRVR
jgi:hypothetical protein